jgi:hypothetical protein
VLRQEAFHARRECIGLIRKQPMACVIDALDGAAGHGVA